MNNAPTNCATQFDDATQQRAAVSLGMWIFLTTEVLFFGGMFVAYAVYRLEYPEVFVAGRKHVNLWAGAIMTSFNNAAFAELEFGGRSAQLFFVLFFCMTGLHAVHMIIGISLVVGLAFAVHRSPSATQLRNPLKVIGLYWHFVDIVWIFLYPLFYLVR